MNVVAWIPIKLDNERLPGKNTMSFGDGRPLLCHILETLVGTQGIDETFVYCSDRSIEHLLPEGVRFLDRSPELDRSSTSFNDVVRSFASDVPADYYVQSVSCAPFLSRATIERGLEQVTSGAHDSAMTVLPRHEFAWFNGEPLNFDLDDIARTQDLVPVVTETTGLYIYPRELIMERNRRTGDSPYLIEVSRIEALDIDDAVDFTIADAVFKNLGGPPGDERSRE